MSIDPELEGDLTLNDGVERTRKVHVDVEDVARTVALRNDIELALYDFKYFGSRSPRGVGKLTFEHNLEGVYEDSYKVTGDELKSAIRMNLMNPEAWEVVNAFRRDRPGRGLQYRPEHHFQSRFISTLQSIREHLEEEGECDHPDCDFDPDEEQLEQAERNFDQWTQWNWEREEYLRGQMVVKLRYQPPPPSDEPKDEVSYTFGIALALGVQVAVVGLITALSVVFRVGGYTDHPGILSALLVFGICLLVFVIATFKRGASDE